jgi:hypothetical protein
MNKLSVTNLVNSINKNGMYFPFLGSLIDQEGIAIELGRHRLNSLLTYRLDKEFLYIYINPKKYFNNQELSVCIFDFHDTDDELLIYNESDPMKIKTANWIFSDHMGPFIDWYLKPDDNILPPHDFFNDKQKWLDFCKKI